MKTKPFYPLVCVIFLVQMIQAQPASRSITTGAGAGTGIPVFNSAFRDYWNSDGNVALELQFYASNKIAFCPRVCCHLFGLNQNRFQEDFGSSVYESGGDIYFEHGRHMAIEAGAAFQIYFSQPEDAVHFYLTLGGSYCSVQYEEVHGIFEKAEQKYAETVRDKVSFHGYGPQSGFGLEFWMNRRLCLFSEARFHFLFTTLSPNKPDNDDEIEFVFYYDSKYLAFISLLWGLRINLTPE